MMGEISHMRTICLLGGTGFVGCHLINHLHRAGNWQIKIITRRTAQHRELLVLPRVTLVAANIYDQTELNEQLAGADVVVNLIGILNERGSDGSGFAKAHVALTEKIIAACQTNKIKRLLHMSALNASATDGKSHYLRTKGEAEDLVHAAEGLNVTSFRPSVIFGEGDSFFKRFAKLLVVPSYMFMLPSGHARFAPVWVNDVASAMLQTIDNSDYYGQRYNLCGPKSYTLQELVEYTAKLMGRKRWVIPLGNKPSYFAARLMEFIPTKPYSVDNYNSSQIDSVCNQENPNHFEQLGIMPHSIEAIMPRYFTAVNLREYYSLFRHKARRS